MLKGAFFRGHSVCYRARQLYKNIYVISVSGDMGFVVYKYIID